MTIMYVLAAIALLVYLVLLGAVILQKRHKRRVSRPGRAAPAHPPMDLRLPEDRCDSCLRWSECNGVDAGEGCPWK